MRTAPRRPRAPDPGSRIASLWRGTAQAAALLVAGWLAPSSVLAASDPVFGQWLVESGKAAIEISPCGGHACGRLIWLANPADAAGLPKTDVNNPDPASRGRALCGLRLIDGLTRERAGEWSGGRIYNTRDGRTYGLKISAVGGEKLKVRGFLGLSLLGRTQVWRRASMRPAGCQQSRAALGQ